MVGLLWSLLACLPGQDDYDAVLARLMDRDGDGAERDVDCDDLDEEISPFLTEEPYDGKDNDCDVATPDDDLDQDGFLALDPVEALRDCLDDDPMVHPEADEVWYDGLDNDCDPLTVDDDQDGDGVVLGADGQLDCDDTDPTVHSGAEEVCDEVDNDCDGRIDEGLDQWAPDEDGDLFGAAGSEVITTCDPPDGYGQGAEDCDDGDPAVNPGAVEICDDLVDNDCDGSAGECGWGDALEDLDAELVFTGVAEGDGAGGAMSLEGDVDGDGMLDWVIAAPGLATAEGALGALFVFTAPAGGAVAAEDAWWSLMAPEGYQGKPLVSGLAVGGGTGPGLLAVTSRDNGAALFELPLSGDEDLSDAVATFSDDPDLVAQDLSVTSSVTGGEALSVWIRQPEREGAEGLRAGRLLLYDAPYAGILTAEDAVLAAEGDEGGDLFGADVVVADLNGDGLDDVVVAAPGASVSFERAGAVRLYEGPVASLLPGDEAVVLSGLDGGDALGTALGAWDADLDGRPDLVVSAPFHSDGGLAAGASWVLLDPLGRADGSVSSAEASWGGDGPEQLWGARLESATVLDGSGRPSLVFGVPGHRGVAEESGAVCVILGFEPGSFGQADCGTWIEGTVSGAGFGAALGGGDFDGDGLGELAVGAPAENAGSGVPGSAFLFQGAGF